MDKSLQSISEKFALILTCNLEIVLTGIKLLVQFRYPLHYITHVLFHLRKIKQMGLTWFKVTTHALHKSSTYVKYEPS